MSDLHWCTTCDKAIQSHSNSLYCSEECLRKDAVSHHPMLGYDFAEFKDFPRRSSSATPSLLSLSPVLSTTSSMTSVSPTLSPYTLQSTSYSSLNDDILHLDSLNNNKPLISHNQYQHHQHHHQYHHQHHISMHKPKSSTQNIFFI
ncbi:hypothetical protein BJ944DRAFT_248356 [Cunninghamella echinulata]|nr:hypothetical protein BJ944DRAFT_248356 [Cunninghamella echinulata]